MEANKLSKLPNETELDYHKRLVFGKLVDKTLSDEDYVELSTYVYGKQLSSDVCRREMYGSRHTLELLEKEIKENITDTKVLDKIELQRIEIEKEKIRLQDQKKEYKNLIRMEARWEHLQNEIIKQIKDLNKQKPFLNEYYKESDYELNRQASLLLSDLHTGIEVNNYWNHFNIEILKERINKLKNKVITYCVENEVNILNVELLGDLINGYIHISTRIYNEENIINQTMICSEILSELIYQLAKYIPYIKVYGSIGNHGRCNANIKEHIDTENFEYLVFWYLKSRLEALNNVEFISNKYDGEIIVYKVFNETIFSVHGHLDDVKTVAAKLTKMTKIIPDRIHMGHWHKSYEDEDGSIVCVNGSLSGMDEYAKSKRLVSTPHQKLIIFDEKEGEICTYKIKFKSGAENE